MPFIIFKYQTGPLPFLIETEIFPALLPFLFISLTTLQSGLWSQFMTHQTSWLENTGVPILASPKQAQKERKKSLRISAIITGAS